MSMLARLVALATLAAVSVPLTPASAAEVNFITDFGYNGRHSYFYVALDKGYYKAEGLEVNILRGQGSADAIKKVASGAAVVGFAGENVKSAVGSPVPTVIPWVVVAVRPASSVTVSTTVNVPDVVYACEVCWPDPEVPSPKSQL